MNTSRDHADRGVEQSYAISHFSIACSDKLALPDRSTRWEFRGRVPWFLKEQPETRLVSLELILAMSFSYYFFHLYPPRSRSMKDRSVRQV